VSRDARAHETLTESEKGVFFHAQRQGLAMDISIVIPVFNGGSKIQKCISALQNQKTQRPYEIIVVDDGSTDGSLECISGNGCRIYRQPNQGPAAARNLGVEKARGKIILFTDADCEPLEDWLETMVLPLENDSISGVKGAYLTQQKSIVPRFVQLEYESKYDKMKKDRYIDFIDTYSAGFVKEDFLRAGQYDTRFTTASVEDQEFSFRMWGLGYRMIFHPDAKVFHTHSGTLDNYLKKKFRIGYWKALVLRRHPKKITRDSHTPQAVKFEMVFSMLFLISLSLWPFKKVFGSLALFSLIGFLAVISPFIIKLLRKDRVVALCAPFLLFGRAVSLSLGLMSGALRFHVEESLESISSQPKRGVLTWCLQKGYRILSFLFF
jgi:glycosyltransferase involved in cell wall biosynthesis